MKVVAVNPGKSVKTSFLNADIDEFRSCFGHFPFSLSHELANCNVFSQDNLHNAVIRAAEGSGDAKLTHSVGHSKIDERFENAIRKKQYIDAIEQLPFSDSWIKIENFCEAAPDFKEISQAVFADIEILYGRPIRQQISWTQITLYLASPHIITPFHMDHEQNILCQISGERKINLFDPNDREVMPDTNLEAYYTGDANGAVYRDHIQNKAKVFQLNSGVAVHIPSTAGHWLKNGQNASVAISFAMTMPDIESRAHIYQMNHFLRRLGLNPKSPGISKIADTTKASIVNLFSTKPAKHWDDPVFSGIRRLVTILKLPKWMLQKLRLLSPKK